MNRTFDAAGNTLTVNTTLPAGTDHQAFCYDDLNRLTWAGSTGTPPCQSLTTGSLAGTARYTSTYTYDTNWRLGQEPAGSGYTYRDAAHPHGVTSTGGGYTAKYDAVGDDMTCRAPTGSKTCSGGSPTGEVLQYDAERRMVKWANAPTGATQYTGNAYNGDGDRVWLQATSGSTTTTTKYYYVGQRRLAERVGSTLYYLVADGLSSVSEALDASGNVYASQLYGPYGGLRYQQGTMPTSFGFTGLRSDPSGLMVAESRFYDPAAGQFVSADDALPSGGAILGGLNRYAYVAGNPETLTDMTGHWPDFLDHAVKTVTNVVQAVAPAVAHAVQAAAPVVRAVLDATLGISEMVNDVKTFFNPNTSWQDRFGCVANFAFNAFMDVTTVMGAGEGLRAAYTGLKAGVKIAGKFAGKEAVELGEREAIELAEKGAADAAENGAKDFAEDVCKAVHSFAYDTPVTTPDGEQAIGTLKGGDQVMAYDGATGKVKAETVQHVFINHDENLLDVTLAAAAIGTTQAQNTTAATQKQQGAAVASHGSQAPSSQEVLHTTTEHPFLTAELGWVNAQDLKPGEHVQRVDGLLGIVVGTRVVPGTGVRYNLTVAEDHTYFVGMGRWVVHNCGEDLPLKYESSPKHEAGGWGSPMDLDASTAQKVLEGGIRHPNGIAIWNVYQKSLYVFRITNETQNIWHGYKIFQPELKIAQQRAGGALWRQLLKLGLKLK